MTTPIERKAMPTTTTSHRGSLALEIQEMTDVVGLEDLTDPELEALRALLTPAYARASGYRPATSGDREALICRVKSTMTAVTPEDLTTQELDVLAAVLDADRVSRPAENVITFAACRRRRARHKASRSRFTGAGEDS